MLAAVGEDAAKVAAFLERQKFGPTVTVTVDPTTDVARRWGQDRFPTTFLVDSSQIIRHINRGYGRGFRARIVQWLRDIPRPSR